MKNLVIISIYDGGYGFSVMYEENIYHPKQWDFEKSTIADKVRRAYYRHENFKKWLKAKFKDKEIIICEDGGIEKL